MSRLRDLFARTRAAGRAALIGYLPAGFPSYDGCIDAFRAMIHGGVDGESHGGVDAVEVGLPYSDPVLDGPTIQAAADAALRAGTTTASVLDTLATVVGSGGESVPVLLMTYWNPVLRYGVERFATALRDAGGSGVITPDLTPDEAGDWLAVSDATGLDRVFLVAPSSTDARLRMTARACRGFVYASSVMGVTGTRAVTSALAPRLVARVREVTDLPVGVGLGVSTGAQAAQVARYADAVIVGSAFVRCLLDAPSPAAGARAVGALASELAVGVRSATREPAE